MSLVAGLAPFGRSAALIRGDGRLLAGAAEEQLSRRSRDPGLPFRALRAACAHLGVGVADLDAIIVAEQPAQRFARVLGELATGFPGSIRDFAATLQTWLGGRLWIANQIVKELAFPPERLVFVERARAQAAGAFLGSPFASAAVLIVDRAGEWAATTLARGTRSSAGASIETLAEIAHPHALSYALEALGRHFLLPESGGISWIAALAAFGADRLRDVVAPLVPSLPGGAYALGLRCFAIRGGAARLSRYGRERLGEISRPTRSPAPLKDDADSRRRYDLLASLRACVAERCLELVREARRRTGEPRLCLGGSLFLDPGILAAVLRDGTFEAVHVDPLLDEAGAANGAAWLHEIDARTWGAATAGAAPPAPVTVSGEAVDAAADSLACGGIVAWVQGAMDLDPRLGPARLLIIDPAHVEAAARLHREVKTGEDWVPFGMLASRATLEEWLGRGAHPAEQSLLASVALPRAVAETMRGSCHCDGTALVLTPESAGNAALGRLLEAFARRTGRIAALAISSLNRTGEPTALLADDVADFLRRTPVDLAVVDGVVVGAEVNTHCRGRDHE